MAGASVPHLPRGLALYLLDELGRRGPSREFWASFRSLAPRLSPGEVGLIRRRAERPTRGPGPAVLHV